MATAFPSTVESIFDVTAEQIRVAFDRIIAEVRSRRDQLLSEIEDRRREFDVKNSAMFESVRELKDMRIHFEKMSVKQNVAMKKQQESLASIDSEIVALRTNINRNTRLKYSCSLDQLIKRVRQFGEIIDATSNLSLAKAKYSKKLKAVRSIKISECNYSSMRLHIDPSKELLYITHSSRNTVRIYNANDFKFVQEFGDTRHPPECVTSSKKFIYVTSTDENILQYKSSDLSLVAAIYAPSSQWGNFYIGIGVSDENQVFVLDNWGYIKIFDRALNLKEDIKLDSEMLKKLKSDMAVSIFSRMVMMEDKLFILSTNKKIIFLSLGNWKNVNFYFKEEEGKIPYVTDPSTFCIDSAGNVIVADAGTSSIKFLSPEGDLIHTIGESIVGSDSISECTDIAVYKDSVIVACRDSNWFHIKMY